MQRLHLSALSCLALLATTAPANADLVITEIVDAPLPGGLPKWVELTNTGSADVDLSAYSIGNINNGGTTLGGGSASVLSGNLPAGATYVLCYEADNGPGGSMFFSVYAQDPDFYFGGAYINGDDCVALYLGAATGDGSDATLVDVYGEIGTDGTGTTWEYADSYAYRCGNTANGGIFDEGDWTIAGVNALEDGCGGDDTCETINVQNETDPWNHAGCAGSGCGTSFCFGNQGTCPCGNENDGTGGDAGCANGASSGGGTLSTSGSCSILGADLVLTGSGLVPSQPGLYFQGNNAINGGGGNPFGDGLRCAGGGVIRLQVAFADAGGSSATTIDVGSKGAVIAGDVKRYQLWYRDPNSSPCGGQFNLSNGMEITWGA